MSAPGTDVQPTEADLLAPWRAVDRLDAADAALFDRLTAEDGDVARRLAVAMEERDETIALNEALPAPSAAAREKLFARIEAAEASPVRAAGLGRWFANAMASLSPSTLAWGATAAVLVIAVQGGLLATSYVGGGEARYETASDGTEVVIAGQKLLVGFAPTATADAVVGLLRDQKAEIIAGPKPGGVFVVKVAEKALEKAELEDAMKRLRDRTGVVRFVAPQSE